MLFWILIALISAVAVVVMTHPLLSIATARPSPDAVASARAIYDAQLAELESETSQTSMTPAELESAKAELGRRMLRAMKEAAARSAAPAKRDENAKWIAVALSVLLPVGALAIYLELGSPGVPSQTAEARQEALADRKQYASIVAALEAALSAGKGDAAGWRMLAQGYRNLDEPAKALDALKRAGPWLKAKGDPVPPDILAALGSGLVTEAQGTVTVPAVEALRDALAGDPKNLTARFYLGLERAQKGDADGARAFWAPLLAELPKGTPLNADLEKRLKELPPTKP